MDFGASDAPLGDQQLKEMPALVQVPESSGPVCITYNLPELKVPLKLSGTTLAGIYLGKIKSWQDPAVKKENPSVSLPAHDIVVAHRSDGIGTTNIFTSYLAKIDSEGVTGVVKQTPGGICYVELTYATDNKLPAVSVKNQTGSRVQPTAAGTTAAINAFAAQLAKDVRTPIVDPPASAKNAYPISGLTFLLVPKHGKDPKKTGTLKQFIAYAVTQGPTQAQSMAYAPISPTLQQQDENLLSRLGGTAQPAQAKLKGASAEIITMMALWIV